MRSRVAILLGMAAMAGACEPAVPLMQAMSGSLLTAGSLIGVLATVAFKCGLFAWLVPRGRRLGGAGRMLGANLLSGVMGLLLVVGLAVPPLIIPSLGVVLLVSWLPARRLGEIGVITTPPSRLAFLIALLFLIDVFLWSFSRGIADHDQSARIYWAWKIAWLVPAVGIALLTGTMWEDWAVSRLGGSLFADERSQLVAVFRANAGALALAMLIGAVLAFPKRLADPNFLLNTW